MQKESTQWLKEADKIIAAYPENHREYHAMILRHSYERGMYEATLHMKSLMAIKELIVKGEYSDERALEIVAEACADNGGGAGKEKESHSHEPHSYNNVNT